MKTSLKTLLPFLLALMAVLALSGGLAYHNLRTVQEGAFGIAHTHKVLAAVSLCLTSVGEAEMGQRDYLSTGDPKDLAFYQAARVKVTADLARLKALVRRDPFQSQRVMDLKGLIANKLNDLEQTLVLARQDPAAAHNLIHSRGGGSLMAAVRGKVEAMAREEQERHLRLSQQALIDYRVAVLSAAFLAVAGLLLALGFLVQMRGYLAQDQRHDQALQRQKQWLQVTLSSIGDAVIATDAKGSVTFMNPMAEALTGWMAPEAEGQALATVFQILHEPAGHEAAEPMETGLGEGAGGDRANDATLARKDGKSLPIEHSASPILAPDGEVLGEVLVFREVTAQRAAEQVLRESEARFRMALLHSMDAIYCRNMKTGQYEYISPAAETLLGYPLEELMAMDPVASLQHLVHPEDAAAVYALATSTTLTGHLKIDFRMRTKAGDYRWFSNHVTLVQDGHGQPLRRYGTLRDITERRQHEQTLLKLNRTLRAISNSNKALMRSDSLEETAYLTEICQVITRDCGHAAAWVGFKDADAAGTIRPVASAGFAEGCLEALQLNCAEDAAGSPTATAIRTGKPSLCLNTWPEPAFEPWQHQAQCRGYRRSLALPLTDGGQTFGALTIHDLAWDAFGADESALLQELASDLVFGLATGRLRATKAAAEQALRASEANYRAFADFIPAMLFAADAQGLPTDHNLGWYKYTGLTSGQLSVKDWESTIHPEDLDRVNAEWAQCLRTGENFDTEARIRRCSDGSYRWHSGHATLTRDDQGRPSRWYGIMLDIEDRTAAETRVLESQALFRGLADAIPQLCWMADADGSINWFNQRWYEYTGTSPEQMAGWGWQAVQDPAVLPQVLERWRHSLETSEPFEMVFPIRGKDGTFRPFLTRVMPDCDEHGKATRWFGTNTDITEREQIKEVLREEADRKDTFLAVLGHELRNPLAPIRHAVHLLGHPGRQPETIKTACAIIERQVAHLARLVDDLLDVARIARGRIPLKPCTLDLVETARCLLQDYQAVLADKGITLEATLPREPILIEADATRLAQALSNLLHNATKFTGRGGWIRLTVGAEPPERAWVRVEDNGAGIAPDLLASLFDPFLRDKSRVGRSSGDGLGLGLALAKGLAELHGGTLRAHSDGPGRGAAFTLELPMTTAAPVPEPVVPGPGPLRPRRILVVEDNVDAALTLKMLLELDGHVVVVAYDGSTGLDQATAFAPELILCDIGLPGVLDGYGVARSLRSLPGGQGLYLVAMTGFGTQEDRDHALAAGFDAHLTKPVAPEVLQALIAQA
jgi:PAS domain S-box-containing protein